MGLRDFLKTWLFGWLPDIGLSWAFMKFTDDNWPAFWWCLLALTVVQIFFVVKQILAGSLAFHLFLKDRVSEVMVATMQKRKFPPPEQNEDFESYMYRLVTDETFPTDVRIGANGLLGEFYALKQTGFFASLRVTTASDLAAKKYLKSF